MAGPRIWGEWEPRFYGSGTTIVALKTHTHKPHLYVYSDSAVNEDRWMRDRYAMCNQLADFMNGGGERPVWLDDMERINEVSARALTGASIDATGPMIDIDPPNLNWRQDESDEAKNDRARLMDAVFLKQKGCSEDGHR